MLIFLAVGWSRLNDGAVSARAGVRLQLHRSLLDLIGFLRSPEHMFGELFGDVHLSDYTQGENLTFRNQIPNKIIIS